MFYKIKICQVDLFKLDPPSCTGGVTHIQCHDKYLAWRRKTDEGSRGEHKQLEVKRYRQRQDMTASKLGYCCRCLSKSSRSDRCLLLQAQQKLGFLLPPPPFQTVFFFALRRFLLCLEVLSPLCFHLLYFSSCILYEVVTITMTCPSSLHSCTIQRRTVFKQK